MVLFSLLFSSFCVGLPCVWEGRGRGRGRGEERRGGRRGEGEEGKGAERERGEEGIERRGRGGERERERERRFGRVIDVVRVCHRTTQHSCNWDASHFKSETPGRLP